MNPPNARTCQWTIRYRDGILSHLIIDDFVPIKDLNGIGSDLISIRKNQKDHGIIKWIEGDLSPGDRVAIVEDVVTTGGSTIKAIERARVEGLKVERIIVLVDRQEGGVAAIQKLVPDVVSLITRDELLEVYSE